MKKQRAAANCLILAALIAAGSYASEPVQAAQPKHTLDIRPRNPKEWRDAPGNVSGVLNSAAAELWKYFPERTLPPIEVSCKSGGSPITLFQRGPGGEIRIKLNTGDALWAQYAFQFAHEMCHVLCDTKPHENPNHWFEESLCEMASLFVLRRMAVSWTSETNSNWKAFAPHFKEYADERSALGKLPGDKTFVDWFNENERDMRLNSTDRARNNIAAGMLLPLFEAEPEMWEAVGTLNTEKLNKLYSFKQYLEAWRRNSQEKHRGFIDKIARQFGLVLE